MINNSSSNKDVHDVDNVNYASNVNDKSIEKRKSIIDISDFSNDDDNKYDKDNDHNAIIQHNTKIDSINSKKDIITAAITCVNMTAAEATLFEKAEKEKKSDN